MPDADPIQKAHEIVVAGMRLEGTSTQKMPDELETPENALEPPINMEMLAKLSQVSAIRHSIIDALARNTVGLGYEIQVAFGHEEEITDPRTGQEEATTILEALASRDERMDGPTFTDLLFAVKTDEEEVGWGFLEVSRNKGTGKIDGLFHVPGKNVRRLKTRDGYVLLQPSGEKNTEFYDFGEKVVYDKGTGAPTNQLQPGKRWTQNEVICFKLYSSESRDYGMPRDAALALEYAGDKLASEYNVSFFDSGGTPPTILFIHAETEDGMGQVTFRVPQDTVSRIANTIKSDAGHQNKVSIIPLPPNSKVDKVVLGEVSERDMGFVNFRQDLAIRFLSAFRMQPVFIGIQAESRYDAEVQRAITLEQLFDPEQDRYEARLGLTVMKDLGYESFAIKFKRMAVESDQARRDSSEKMAEAGSITRREFRQAHGWGPIPEADEGQEPKPGQVPHGWNDEIIDLGQPKGAENRSTTDNRGLKAGIGERVQRSTDAELEIQRQQATEKLRSVTGA